MRPTTLEELIQAIEEANKSAIRLLPVCMGSKAWMGPPATYDEVLELGGLPKVFEIDEEEMVLRTSPCIPAAEAAAALEKKGRRLALDPPLFTTSSLGGIVATNLYGAMAYRFFTPRDQLLSVKAVTGEGKLVKLGAPVVKDVAGYNLKRLLAGSWGTLAVAVELYIRIYATPESVAVVKTRPTDLTQLRKAAATAAVEKDGDLYLRFEGTAAEVEYRVSKHRGEVYYGREAERLWRQLTDAGDVFKKDVVAKTVAPPSQLPDPPPGAAYIKYPLLGVMYTGGDAPPGAYYFKPQRPWKIPNLDLMCRIKKAFDPRGVLSPGRIC